VLKQEKNDQAAVQKKEQRDIEEVPRILEQETDGIFQQDSLEFYFLIVAAKGNNENKGNCEGDHYNCYSKDTLI
jgi:hypothetical protein